MKENIMHKDLSDDWRDDIERAARHDARRLHSDGQSLALGREAWNNAFDEAAAELDSTVAKQAEVG